MMVKSKHNTIDEKLLGLRKEEKTSLKTHYRKNNGTPYTHTTTKKPHTHIHTKKIYLNEKLIVNDKKKHEL